MSTGFTKPYYPGFGHGFSSSRRVVEVVFPLPLDLEQAEDGKLLLRAPHSSAEDQMKIVANFKPQGTAAPIHVTNDGSIPTGNGQTKEWHLEIPWPQGAESGKASLYYAEQEISTVALRRWVGAGTLRAALDCYFDPDHKRLKEGLLGHGQKTSNKAKASQPFEEACVRLMNLLDVPLIWYGEKWTSSGRNDGAGLVDKKEKRVVVLAECTSEKPEAKFVPLKERAQNFGEFLRVRPKCSLCSSLRPRLPARCSKTPMTTASRS